MARPDPHNWIGPFKAALGRVVLEGYAPSAQAQALEVLRAAHALDHEAIGPWWEPAMQASARAGFASGIGFMLDHALALPPATLVRLRHDFAHQWPETLNYSATPAPTCLALSPSGQNPPSIPTGQVQANTEMARRLFLDPGMPQVSWKCLHGLVMGQNIRLATDLATSGRIEPLASRASIEQMLRLVDCKSGLFTLSELAVVAQAPASWTPSSLALAVFSLWWHQAPNLARHGQAGCLAVLDMLRAIRVPNSAMALSGAPGQGVVASAMQLLQRSGYSPQQVFRCAARHMDRSLAAVAIVENEPETLAWMIEQGLDVSSGNFALGRFSASPAASSLAPGSFWAAAIERIDLCARQAENIPERAPILDRWWASIQRAIDHPTSGLVLRSQMRSAKVSFTLPATQARWESLVGRTSLQRTVAQASPEPPRPARF